MLVVAAPASDLINIWWFWWQYLLNQSL